MRNSVCTLLEEYDFSGKTIIPFCTHEGSGLGYRENDIVKLCPNTSLLKGLAIHGSRISAAKEDVTNWLSNVGIE